MAFEQNDSPPASTAGPTIINMPYDDAYGDNQGFDSTTLLKSTPKTDADYLAFYVCGMFLNIFNGHGRSILSKRIDKYIDIGISGLKNAQDPYVKEFYIQATKGDTNKIDIALFEKVVVRTGLYSLVHYSVIAAVFLAYADRPVSMKLTRLSQPTKVGYIEPRHSFAAGLDDQDDALISCTVTSAHLEYEPYWRYILSITLDPNVVTYLIGYIAESALPIEPSIVTQTLPFANVIAVSLLAKRLYPNISDGSIYDGSAYRERTRRRSISAYGEVGKDTFMKIWYTQFFSYQKITLADNHLHVVQEFLNRVEDVFGPYLERLGAQDDVPEIYQEAVDYYRDTLALIIREIATRYTRLSKNTDKDYTPNLFRAYKVYNREDDQPSTEAAKDEDLLEEDPTLPKPKPKPKKKAKKAPTLEGEEPEVEEDAPVEEEEEEPIEDPEEEPPEDLPEDEPEETPEIPNEGEGEEDLPPDQGDDNNMIPTSPTLVDSNTIKIISILNDGGESDPFIYKSAVLAVYDIINKNPDINYPADKLALLKTWCTRWLFLADTTSTQEFITSLGLADTLRQIQKKV